MKVSTPRRIFAGAKARELRLRLRLSQMAMAHRVGISTSYLSQIESDDRPMTDAVLVAFTRAFPQDWVDLSPDQEATLLAQAMFAAQDSTIPGPDFAEASATFSVGTWPSGFREVARHGPPLSREVLESGN